MENNIEKIEDLIAERLNKPEADEVLRFVDSDANAKQEFAFQKNVINEISAVRERELKARLGALAVSTGGLTLAKKYLIAAGVASVTLVSGLYLSSTEDQSVASDQEMEASISLPTLDEDLLEDQKTQLLLEEESSEILAVQSTAPKELSSKKEVVRSVVSSKDNSNSKIPDVVLPGDLNSGDDELLISSDNEENTGTEGHLADIDEGTVMIIPQAKKNRFHYKFDGNAVYVQIADYSAEKPAVLIDYPEKKELYLSYGGKYYELSANSSWQSLTDHLIKSREIKEQLNSKIK
jgi:hypothetical protein